MHAPSCQPMPVLMMEAPAASMALASSTISCHSEPCVRVSRTERRRQNTSTYTNTPIHTRHQTSTHLGHQVEHGEAEDDDEVPPHRLPHRLDHLHGEAHPVPVLPAPGVRPPVVVE